MLVASYIHVLCQGYDGTAKPLRVSYQCSLTVNVRYLRRSGLELITHIKLPATTQARRSPAFQLSDLPVSGFHNPAHQIHLHTRS